MATFKYRFDNDKFLIVLFIEGVFIFSYFLDIFFVNYNFYLNRNDSSFGTIPIFSQRWSLKVEVLKYM